MAKLFSDREIRAIAVFLPLAGLLIIALMLVRPAADPEAARRAEAEMEEALPADSVVMSHFDPNTASLDDLRRLGLTKHEAVSLLKYRAAGKVFRIPEDLTLCYGISDSLYRRLEPWVRIGRKYAIAPEKYRTGRILPEPLAPGPFRIDTVSARYLRAIGALSKRQAEAFIRWRDLSGIYDMEDLRECYVVSDSVAAALEPYVIFPERKPHPIEEPVELNTADSAALRSVSGIGPKTARQIFEICPSLEDIRDHFVLLPPKIQDKMRGHLEDMFIWRELTTLSLKACESLTLDDMAVRPLNVPECRALAEEFELFALRREMASLLRRQSDEDAAAPPRPGARTEDAASGAEGAAAQKAGAQNVSFAAASSGGVSRSQTRTGAQMSLLDAVEEPLAPELSDVAALPDCAGRHVALIWPQGPKQPPHLAVGDPLSETTEPAEYCWTGRMDMLCAWLQSARRLVVADLKALLTAAPCWRNLPLGETPPRCFDLGLAAYLLNPEESDYGWPRLAARWGAALKPEGGGPARLALAMAEALEDRLVRDGLRELYNTLELPLTPVLAEMEGRGVAIDAAAFQAFLSDVQHELDRLTAEVYAAAGTTFNIRSAQQLGDVLFKTLNLPSPRKTKGGQASTSQQTLEKLAGRHAVVDSILQFRKLEKMRSTYLDPLPRLVDGQGRIHTTFNQKATATGRLSSSNPNLQNIPVRTEQGREIRRAFIPRPGWVLLDADYSQIELRLMAHFSGDTALIEAFRTGQVPADPVAAGKAMVTQRFATSNLYFAVDKLVAGAVRQIQRGIEKVGSALKSEAKRS